VKKPAATKAQPKQAAAVKKAAAAPAPAKASPKAQAKPASAKSTPKPAAKPVAAAKPAAKPAATKPAAPKAPAKAVKPAAAPAAVEAPKAAPAQPAAKPVAKPATPPPAPAESPTKQKTKAEPQRKPAAPAQLAGKTTAQTEKAVIRKVTNLDEVKLPQGYRPSPDEEYMNPMHMAYFKQKLENWRQELIAESQETLEHLRTETRDVGDEAERASRESDNILELRTRDRYRKLLHKIEEAIKRIEDGSYGYCEETGEEIGLGRLEARPIATLTVDAQERREMFQKQFRDDH